MTKTAVRRWFAWVLAVVAIGGLGTAQAQTSLEALEAQLTTAVQHAEFSMTAADHAMALRHLGHVLNCIAGEEGDGFDGSWGHPCGGQGLGIVQDVAAHPHAADVAALLAAAHELAKQGVNGETLGAVHAAAAGVRALLQVLAGFGG
jgi:polysaccharide deacetylase 2 family uncharacterized protein YibQ